jgi:Ca2+-binding EF-hand superfamily protein
MTNLDQFSFKPDLLSLCMASVARQVDHSSLTEIRDVFCLLDSDGDGTLDRQEVEAGFKIALGRVPDNMASIFSHLDLDQTGRISYTEFCAAALGDHSFIKESELWAAFKAFDLADDGRISLSEMQTVLASADVNQVWSQSVCQNVAAEVVEKYGDFDNTINFSDWLHLMQECSSRCCMQSLSSPFGVTGKPGYGSLTSDGTPRTAISARGVHRRSASVGCFPCVDQRRSFMLQPELYRRRH